MDERIPHELRNLVTGALEQVEAISLDEAASRNRQMRGSREPREWIPVGSPDDIDWMPAESPDNID